MSSVVSRTVVSYDSLLKLVAGIGHFESDIRFTLRPDISSQTHGNGTRRKLSKTTEHDNPCIT